MKRIIYIVILIMIYGSPAAGADMREAVIRAKETLSQRKQADRAVRETISREKSDIKSEIAALQSDIAALKTGIRKNSTELETLTEKRDHLAGILDKDRLGLDELSGAVKVAARDLESVVEASHFSAGRGDRLAPVRPLLEQNRFPGLEDINAIISLFFEDIVESGEVVLRQTEFVDRSGETVSGDILTAGKFTAVYNTANETGFLEYDTETRKFYSLPALPSYLKRRQIAKYISGKADALPMDISGGAALKQLTRTPSWWERIRNGGLIVWPILLLGIFALLIGIERIIFLRRVHANTDEVMSEVNDLARNGKWDECYGIAEKGAGRPVYNVIRAGLDARGEERETLESILQEAILKELPRLERFLPVLNILGAVAPLLGLLGTVTGMITTFHVITLYGTGDPRMMSGGISEALVTTMLGLTIAIPIMLGHTFLSRQVDHIIGDMEEKAVAMSNIINREKLVPKPVKNSPERATAT